jgi:hypothetical protein
MLALRSGASQVAFYVWDLHKVDALGSCLETCMHCPITQDTIKATSRWLETQHVTAQRSLQVPLDKQLTCGPFQPPMSWFNIYSS